MQCEKFSRNNCSITTSISSSTSNMLHGKMYVDAQALHPYMFDGHSKAMNLDLLLPTASTLIVPGCSQLCSYPKAVRWDVCAGKSNSSMPNRKKHLIIDLHIYFFIYCLFGSLSSSDSSWGLMQVSSCSNRKVPLTQV